ncbi:ccaat/enhancer binding protein [Anaeramoeba flamelloides]|uniref:Ccaat/enhancer binding protein n=1 Tax=Anaeramoeba flamelloides TaxID=1746091 RepID=A0AAV7YVC0_9EUKA|nr:ccaat/enhancer binding protein [Anaeramoeba flamelloides]
MSTYPSIPSLDFLTTDFGRFDSFESETTLIGKTATIEMPTTEKITETINKAKTKTKAMPKPKSKTTTKPTNTRKRKKSNTASTSSEEILKRKRELNRISARKSREKKKIYISQIEREVDELRQERQRLIKLVNSLNQEVERQRKRSDVDLLFHLLQKKFGINSSLFTSQLNNSYLANHNPQNN